MRICFDLLSLSSSGASIVASGLAEKVQDVESTQVARRVQGMSVGFRGDRGLLE
jgi:hypothetical protein